METINESNALQFQVLVDQSTEGQLFFVKNSTLSQCRKHIQRTMNLDQFMFYDPNSETTFDQNDENKAILEEVYMSEIHLITEKQKRIGAQSTIDIEQKKEELLNWEQVIIQMPECAERTLLVLIKTTWNTFIQKSPSNNEEEIEKLLTKFKAQVALEGLESDAIKEGLIKHKTCMIAQRPDLEAKQLELIYNKIVVFNIYQTEKLIHQNDKAAQLIAGQNVILLVGGTGAGKSTTIQFLAGSEMEEVKIQGLKNIQPKTIKNQMLQNVKSSPFAKSETQYITPVIVDTAELGLRGKGQVTLCDSPGFGDNRGTEVDIANAIGIIKAVHGCESVRLVIVLGQKGMGERLEGLQAIVDILIEMIPNVTQFFNCIQYVFTKYSDEEKDQIFPFINSKYNNLNDSEKQNTTFVSVIEDLLEKIEQELIVVNPLSKDPKHPKQLFSKLLTIHQIKNPNEQFVIALSEKSKTAIKDQMLLHQQSITSAVIRSDYELVGYKLDQMKRLYDLLNYEYIHVIYQECVKQIIKHTQSEYQENKKLITRCFSPFNELTLQDMELYKIGAQRAKNIEKIKVHLNEELIDESIYIQELKISIQALIKEFENISSLLDQKTTMVLDKLKIVVQSFPCYHDHYEIAKQKILSMIEALTYEYRNQTNQNNFEDSLVQIKLIQSASAHLGEHIPQDIINNTLNELKQYTIGYLASIQSSTQALFENANINQEDVIKISQSIEFLENAQISYSKISFFKQDEVNGVYISQLNKALDLFSKINLSIEEHIKQKKTKLLSKIKPFVDQLSLLQSIPSVQLKTTSRYYKTIEQIIGQVQDLKRDVDHILKQLISRTKGVNFSQLAQSIQNLQDAQWIEELRPGVYQDVMANIKEQVLDQCEEMKLSIIKCSLDLSNSDRIEDVCQQMSEINEMNKLKALFPDIEGTVRDANDWFTKQLESVFQIIKTKFDLQIIKTSEIKSLDYKKAELSFKYLQIMKNSNLIFLASEIQEQTRSLYETFQDFLTEYFSFMQNDLQVSRDIIISSEKDIIQNVQNIGNRMREVNEIDKYPLIGNFFEQKNKMLQHWQQIFTKDANEFSSQLVELIQATNFNKSISMLEKVKAMSELDQYTGEQKFSKIYSEFQKQIISNDAPKLYKEAQEAILNHDYQKVAQSLPSMEVDNNALFQQQLKYLKNLLNCNVEELIETILNKLRSFLKQAEKDDDQFQEKLEYIHFYLKKYDNAKKNLSNYFNDNLKQLIPESQLQICGVITKGLKNLLLILDTFITNNNYNEAGKLKVKIDSIKELIEKYIEQSISDQIDQLQEKLNKQLTTLINQFEANDFYYIRQNQLKEIIRQLSIDDNQFYRSTIAKLKEIIEDKLMKELNQIQDEQISKIKRNQIIKNIEQHFKYLPDNLKDEFEPTIAQIKDSIDSAQKAQEEELAAAIRLEDFDTISILYQDYRSSKIYAEKTRDIKLAVFAYSIKQDQKTQQLVSEHNLNELLYHMKSFYEFKKQHEGFFISEITKSYENSKKLFEKTVKQSFDILQSWFPSEISYYDSSPTQRFTISFESQFTDLSSISCGSDDSEGKLIAQATGNLIQIMHFNLNNQNILQEFSSSTNEKAFQLNKKIGRYFSDLTQKFKQEILTLNVPVLKMIFKNLKSRQCVLSGIKEVIKIYEDLGLNVVSQSIKESLNQMEMSQQVCARVMEIKKELLNFNLLYDTKQMFQAQRRIYYQNYKDKLKTIQSLKGLASYIESPNVDIIQISKECEHSFNNKIKEIIVTVVELIQKNKLYQSDCAELSKNYNNLLDISLCLDLKDEKILEEIKSITGIFNNKVKQMVEQAQKSIQDNKALIEALIDMKLLSENINEFKIQIDNNIDFLLQHFKDQKGKEGANAIAKLGILLQQDSLGKTILLEHKIFEGFTIALFNTRTQVNKVDKILNDMKGDDIDITILTTRFVKFNEKYQAYVKLYLKEPINIQPLINEVISLAGKLTYKNNEIKWPGTTVQNIPQILAYIFAIWTLQNSDNYFNSNGVENQENYLLQPHPAQVISIFRLLGVGDKDEKLQNNLVQIGTGQGKSVILGIAACVLALFGIDVSCACYSEYLSQRDSKQFQRLFEALNVLPHIKYATFNTICESLINEKGDIRKIVTSTITTGNIEDGNKKSNNRPKALLIDEVDVFFSKEFYGKVFIPSATISDPTISALLDYIWKNKNSDLTSENIIESEQFTQLNKRFKGWDLLFQEVVIDLLYDVKHFEEQVYFVKNNKIGYQDNDSITFNIKYGYKTLFSYYKQHFLGNISEESLNQNKILNIKCGSFSYCEIPPKFQLILGVTGTLQTLNSQEKNVIENEYNIMRYTFTPSVFGDNKMDPKMHILIEKKDDYFKALNQEIDNRIKGIEDGTKRAVLVFFETKQELFKFLHSPAFQSKKENAKFLTEEALIPEKEIIVRNSTISGSITLLTKSFGRGTDFRGRDQVVAQNGGVHVITTFLSEDISEEIQIKGRTARQGEHGSFSMVLLDTTLEKFLISIKDIEENKEDYYDLLNKKREAYQINRYKGNTKYINQIKKDHKQSQVFLQSVNKKDLNKMKEHLVRFNKGVVIHMNKYKTLVLMDITGSMHALIENAKNTIQIMFERVGAILKYNGVEDGRVMMQIAGYRNYNSRVEELFINSSWETKPDNLKKFLSNLKAANGWGEEAIEIGLQHANEENAKEKISQVILIGDGVSNKDKQMVKECRERFGENYWSKTRFPIPTLDTIEIQKLTDAKVKVHAFYVIDEKNVRNCFTKYAKATGGRHQFLDVTSEKGPALLTDLITEEILRDVGGAEFVKQYQTLYGKSYS